MQPKGDPPSKQEEEEEEIRKGELAKRAPFIFCCFFSGEKGDGMERLYCYKAAAIEAGRPFLQEKGPGLLHGVLLGKRRWRLFKI